MPIAPATTVNVRYMVENLDRVLRGLRQHGLSEVHAEFDGSARQDREAA